MRLDTTHPFARRPSAQDHLSERTPACRDDVDARQAHPDDVEAALTAYEQALFPRAAAEAARDFDLCFGETPRSLIDLLTGAA